MGAPSGAYERMVRDSHNRELRDVRNNEASKAAFWADLIASGHVLTFKTASGATITAGPYQTAVPGYNPGAALLGPRLDYHDNARGVAWRIVQLCGRQQPIRVTEPALRGGKAGL